MYKHILLAAELTDDTTFLTKKVKALRELTKAKLSIVHVVEPLPGYSYAYLGIEDIEGQLIEESKKALKKMAKKLNIKEKDCWVEIGPTKSKILEIAAEVKADVIMCGSHGRHGLSLLLGSTANAVIHGAKCDVVIVRLPEDK